MDKKRGGFLLVLVLLVLGSCLINAQEDGEEVAIGTSELILNNHKFTSFAIGCDGCDEEDCGRDNIICGPSDRTYEGFNPDADLRCKFFLEGSEISDILTSEDDPADDGGCIDEFDGEGQLKRSGVDGCWVIVVEDDANTEDCGAGRVSTGWKFTPQTYTKFPCRGGVEDRMECRTSGTWGRQDSWEGGDGWFGEGDSDDAECMMNVDANDDGDGWKSDYPGEHLCADDYYWHYCTEEDIGTVTWVNNKLYNCTKQEHNWYAEWEELDYDYDKDGYTTGRGGDCADNPTDNRLQQEGCPELDEETGEIPCEYPLHSKCAICINPSAPEVCGDEINNDCGGEGAKEAYGNLDGNTPDSCHQFPAGCQKEKLRDEDGQEIGAQHNNIYDESFSWQPLRTEGNNEAGYCCGYGGIADLGKTGTSEEGNFVCLNNQKELVGHEGEAIAGWNEELCGESWCWIRADGDANFHILTIKKPGEEAYDVVSNNNNWFKCDDEGTKRISNQVIMPDDIKNANRFYCYQEGNRMAWADCRDPEEPIQASFNGIKERKPGDGLFALTTIPAGSSVLINLEGYKAFYQEGRFDLPEGNLELMVRFTSEEIIKPAGVFLRVYGPEGEGGPQIYFEQSILAYGVNSPLIEKGRWIHVKVPLPAMKGIKAIRIESEPEENQIEVQNVYLSESDKPKLCSGETSERAENSAWLDNLDSWVEGNPISGKKICNTLFNPEGEKAWLGEREINVAERRCCGDDEKEYYAGESKNKYGCWNSQVVEPGKTVMNVEFKVGYKEKKRAVSYPEKNIDFEIEYTCQGEEDDENNGEEQKKVQVNGRTVTLETSPLKIELIDDKALNCDGNKKFKLAEITNNNEEMEVYFLNSFTGEDLGSRFTEGNLKYYNLNSIIVIAETKAVNIGREETITPPGLPKPFTYACSQEECIYPLPGFPEYQITNLHPELYELYFVQGSRPEEETLIKSTNQWFDVPGNLKAKKIAQQVIFVNKEEEREEGAEPVAGGAEGEAGAGEEEEAEQGFYGCQAAEFIEKLEDTEGNKVLKENLDYCSIKGDKFCAHSVVHQPSDEPRERYTTINSWSDKDLDKIGYQEVSLDEEIPEEFSLIEGARAPAKERKWSSTIVPGRNFVPNAEFQLKGRELPHWEIIGPGGVVLENEKEQVGKEEGEERARVVLPEGYKLKSEKVAVNKSAKLLFTMNSSCETHEIRFYDKDGDRTGGIFEGGEEEAGEGEESQINIEPAEEGIREVYNSEEASYLVMEFIGPCEIKQLMLQSLDSSEVADYTYNKYIERQGVACCPHDACWNGYACVKEMSKLSYMKEQVGEERFYRCIKGEWRQLPLQWDWNAQEFGFCQEESQCFVVDSLKEGADPEAKAEDFYEGKLPVCIKEGEFIFDHYCEEGKWTSRTKFLASRLIEFAENDEFILYCTDYRRALQDYEDKENYLGGATSVEVEEGASLEEALGGESGAGEEEMVRTCFPALGSIEGKRLVPEKENTCINNVCVLRYKEGGRFKSAFGTTLNKNVSKSESFLMALDIPQDKLNEVCRGGEEGLVECELAGLERGEEGLWYSSKVRGLVYGKEGINIGGGVINRILDWFSGLFGEEELSEERKFVEKAVNFKELYLLNKGGKKIRAMQEIFPKKRTLVAEYEGFSTPVCDYLSKVEVPPEARLEIIEAAAGRQKINCTQEGGKQRVVAVEGLDFLWPQLTGKLRVGG